VSTLLQETEELFYRLIPITRAMGVRVAEYDGRQLVLEAPLALNHNHLGTAFGGSLNAIATLAAYGWVWLELRDPACHVVVRDSSISFRRPVRHDLRAVCHRPEESLVSAFRAGFMGKGKGRIELSVSIEEASLTAVQFVGTFVATK
jgi:thioesterase domain-containing protein